MADLAGIRADLAEEHADLDAIVAGLPAEAWDTLTPAEPWTVRDQISHLTFFDETAALAASDPDAFNASLQEAAADVDGYINRPLEEGRALTPEEVLVQWRDRRRRLLDAAENLDSSARIPWYGPPMSPASFLSARLMETWAHGQDVADALGVTRTPTDRLKHIAHLGVRTRGWSYTTNAKQVPESDVRVELTAPSGEVWTWGESETEKVSGPALDFCFVVTQRRHVDDTALKMEGPAAAEWMSIAQAFAGGPGEGRQPGQFAVT